jgi:hypothetical protein
MLSTNRIIIAKTQRLKEPNVLERLFVIAAYVMRCCNVYNDTKILMGRELKIKNY